MIFKLQRILVDLGLKINSQIKKPLKKLDLHNFDLKILLKESIGKKFTKEFFLRDYIDMTPS